jgi:hypothetical protein
MEQPPQEAEEVAAAPEPVMEQPPQEAEEAAAAPEPVMEQPPQEAEEAAAAPEPVTEQPPQAVEEAATALESVVAEPPQSAEGAPADLTLGTGGADLTLETGAVAGLEPMVTEMASAVESTAERTGHVEAEPRGATGEPFADDELREIGELPSMEPMLTTADPATAASPRHTVLTHSEGFLGTQASDAPQSLVEVQPPAAAPQDERAPPLADALADGRTVEGAEGVRENVSSRALQAIPASASFSLDAFVAGQLEGAMDIYAAVSDPVAWTHLRESLIVNGVASFWVGMIALFHCATLYVLYLAPMLVFDYFEHMSRLEALLWKIAFMAALSASAYAFHTHLSFWIALAASLFLTSLLFRM